MPVYGFRCEDCREAFDLYLPLERSNEHPSCERCGGPTFKDMTMVNIAIDKTMGYYDHQLGRYIGSSSDRRNAERELGVEAASRKDIEGIKRRKKPDAERKAEYKTMLQENIWEMRSVKLSSSVTSDGGSDANKISVDGKDTK